MIIWTGFGLFVAVILGGCLYLGEFLVGAGYVPDTPFTLPASLLLAAVIVLLTDNLFSGREDKKKNTLFFIPWIVWGAIFLTASGYTGWQSFELYRRANKKPLAFVVADQKDFDYAATLFYRERDEIRARQKRSSNLSPRDQKKLDKDSTLLNKRGAELNRLSYIYEKKKQP